MRWITQFVAFWYDFIVGDDWIAPLLASTLTSAPVLSSTL
jgi:hypothetical protein